jgi:hypothetical protein
MGVTRKATVVVALGVGVFGLTGCEVSELFGATCSTSPPVPHHDLGSIGVVVDVPPEVPAGSTFDLVVEVIGVGAGAASPEPADLATIAIGGGASPSGNQFFGSITGGTAAEWPTTIPVTATGQPGETIDITVVSAFELLGEIPNAVGLTCRPVSTGPFLRLPIVAPS